MGILMVHRGTSMAAGRCPGGRLKIWVGTVVRPTTTTGGAIWSGGQVKQSHGPSMVRATSIRTGLEKLELVCPWAGFRTHQGVQGFCPGPAAGVA